MNIVNHFVIKSCVAIIPGLMGATGFLGATILMGATIFMGATMAAAEDISHQLGQVKSKVLEEISGVAASRRNPGILWVHNDGESTHVYAITTKGKVVSQVAPDAKVDDVEDLAIGPGPDSGRDYLYLGDIGDNDVNRREIHVIRVPEPSLEDATDAASAGAVAKIFRLIYPDGPHDAEALLVDPTTGDLVIVTKEKSKARVYTAAAASLRGNDPIKLVFVASLEVDNVSAGDISRDATLIALRREEIGWLWERRGGESLQAALARKPRKIPVLGKKQAPNGESFAFHPDGRGYYTVSEGRQGTVYLFDLPTSSHR